LNLFKGKFIIHHGGHPGGFKNVHKKDLVIDPIRLYYVKGTSETNTKAVQVEAKASFLNSNHCFVLITPKRAFAWFGKFAHGDERNVAKLVAETLMSPSQVDVVFETKEKDEFWTHLGGKLEYTTKQAEAVPDFEPRLFQCSNVTGNLEVEEIFNYSQEDLISEDVMILDTWNEIYVWVGSHVNPEEKKLSLDTAIKYLASVAGTSGRNPDHTPILTIKQGFEPPLFTSNFIWDSDKAHAGINNYEQMKKELEAAGSSALVSDASKELAKFNKTYEYEVLLRRPLPEGVDPSRLENHLDEKDFKKAFGCTHDEYLALPKWKREARKKESKLF